MEPAVERGFSAAIERDELMRLLGRRPGAAGEPRGRLADAVDEALETADRLVETAGVWAFVSGADLAPGLFDRLRRMAACVCTIGPALERRVTELTAADELLRALVLDTAGSVAAEAAAEHMDRLISAAAADDDVRTSRRASPGYGNWPVEGQAALFGLVPAGRIGVRLSPGGMMIPRKSVSFAVHVDRNPVRLRSENACENCDRRDCPYGGGGEASR